MGLIFDWLPADHFLPKLFEREIHLWRVFYQEKQQNITEFYQVLARDEQERCSRFSFLKDRHNFIIRRGFFRLILSKYLQINPQDVQFCYTEKGKPYLDTGSLCFNLSHTDKIAVYAFTKGGEIGVDIEEVRPISEGEDIVRAYFSSSEFRQFSQVSDLDKTTAFFNLWTRKEAYLKAVGEGLFYPLNEVEVTFLSNQRAKIIAIGGDRKIAKQWCLIPFTPYPNYIGCMATIFKPISTITWFI